MIPSSTNSQAGDSFGPSSGHDLSAVVDVHLPVPPSDRKDRPATAELSGLTTDEAERRLSLRTLAVVTLVFSGQAVIYVVRERQRMWSSAPGRWLVASSVADLTIITMPATNGLLMTALPLELIAGMLCAAVVLAIILDSAKLVLFHRLAIT